MNKINVLSLFTGVGSFEKSLTKQNIPHEVVAFSEIDKHAIKSYCAMHGLNADLNLGNILNIDTNDIPRCDLMTYGFPCQQISACGSLSGFEDGSNTSSSLLWEAMRIASAKRPKYMIAENVKNLLSKRFEGDFNKWLQLLDEMGYNNYYQVLNASDYNIPHNRERVLVVSIRKDIDNGSFEFPQPVESVITLKDIVEIDFTEKIDKRIMKSCQQPFADEYKQMLLTDKDIHQCEATSGWQDKKVGITVSPCLRANKNHTCVMIDGQIKRLQAKDMFALMGFNEVDYHKCKSVGVSDSQLAKQMGNAIVVNVLDGVLKSLFEHISK